MESLFMSLSHLQHSDTAAVKDSLPQTPAQGETTVKAQVHKSYNQTIRHLCACQRATQRLGMAVTNRSGRLNLRGSRREQNMQSYIKIRIFSLFL